MKNPYDFKPTIVAPVVVENANTYAPKAASSPDLELARPDPSAPMVNALRQLRQLSSVAAYHDLPSAHADGRDW